MFRLVGIRLNLHFNVKWLFIICQISYKCRKSTLQYLLYSALLWTDPDWLRSASDWIFFFYYSLTYISSRNVILDLYHINRNSSFTPSTISCFRSKNAVEILLSASAKTFSEIWHMYGLEIIEKDQHIIYKVH